MPLAGWGIPQERVRFFSNLDVNFRSGTADGSAKQGTFQPKNRVFEKRVRLVELLQRTEVMIRLGVHNRARLSLGGKSNT